MRVQRVLAMVLGMLALGALAVPGAAWTQTLCIKVNKANLRSGPGTNYRVTWEVFRHMPLVEVARDGDWIKVRDVDGDIHWVAQVVVATDEQCTTVRVDKASIRQGPSTKSASVFTVERYTSFKRTGEKTQGKDLWVRLEHEGQALWVSANLVWSG